jgi:hypothetical protein
MLAVQLAEVARVEPQVLLKTAKSPALVPVKPTLLMSMVVVPVLVRVATFCAPDWPMATLLQLMEEGDTLAVAAADAGRTANAKTATPMVGAANILTERSQKFDVI